MLNTDVVVIGAGPAGLAAALKANETASVVLLERKTELGGILMQCIHSGFGNFIFNKVCTGPEYAQHFINKLKKTDVDTRTETTVLRIQSNKRIVATNPSDGILEIHAKAIVLAMGCRERTRNQILIPGSRPAGIYTAGTAQHLINIDGVMPGKKVVILGSGDVGLIMARRFILEGAEVEGVYEIMSKPGGLMRNIAQCLNDYDIPLHLSHTVVGIEGTKRVKGVTVAEVDTSLRRIRGTERDIPCDCLILAVGLIPESELSRMLGLESSPVTSGPIVDERMETSIPGIFACGNLVQVCDLVDDVTLTSQKAGESAARYAKGILKRAKAINIAAGENVSYVVPQRLRGDTSEPVTFYFRVTNEMENVTLSLSSKNKKILEKKQRIVRPTEIVKISTHSEMITDAIKELRIDVRR